MDLLKEYIPTIIMLIGFSLTMAGGSKIKPNLVIIGLVIIAISAIIEIMT